MHLKKAVIHRDRFPTDDVCPFNLPVLKETDALDFPTPVIIFAEELGSVSNAVQGERMATQQEM